MNDISPGSKPEVAPRGPLEAINAILRSPRASLRRLGEKGGGPFAAWTLMGAVGGLMLYGLMSGAFQGGSQLLITAVKAPMIVAISLALCLPSMYVFAALSDGGNTWRHAVAATIGLSSLLALILFGLVPIVWLFSVSSRSLVFIVLLHFCLWGLALLLSLRFLGLSFPAGLSGGAVFLWLCLFFVVSLQVTTVMRPVLWRPTDGLVVKEGKLFFLEHFGEVVNLDRKIRRQQEEGE